MYFSFRRDSLVFFWHPTVFVLEPHFLILFSYPRVSYMLSMLSVLADVFHSWVMVCSSLTYYAWLQQNKHSFLSLLWFQNGWGWGDGSVDAALAAQVWGLEFETQNPSNSWTGMAWVRDWGSLSKISWNWQTLGSTRDPERWRRIPEVNFMPPPASYTCMCTCIHVDWTQANMNIHMHPLSYKHTHSTGHFPVI